jgi:predicted alpha/beta superfamily hydrolase
MKVAALLLALTLACRPDETPVKPDDTGPHGTDTGDTSETGWVECEAELQALAALAEGDPPTSAQVQDVLAQVAAGCGWPLHAGDDRYLFACDCGGGAWSVAGDFNEWAGQPMENHGALHWVELSIPSPIDAGYKLVKAASYQADPWSRRYLYDGNGELSLVRAHRPHLERWPGVEAEGLRSRTVRVWVPEGARFDRVLYAHDGQNLFDPQAIWGGWALQSSLPDGILVVANDNTADRMEEYTHVQDRIHGSWYGGEGDTYAAFVHERLRPWAESRYGAAEIHGLLGSSLGGLISLHIAQRYPGEYDFAASMSGTLGWGSIGASNETMIERYAAAGRQGTVIYLDSGGSGTCYDSDGDGIQDDDPSSSDNYCETVQMAETLAGLGYQYEQDLWHWWEPGASHNEQAWAARVELPLTVFASLD